MKTVSVFLAAVVLLASCSSKTMIQSTPSGAGVYIDSMKQGTTPYRYKDTKISFASTDLTLKKEGYTDLNVELVRDERVDVGAIVGGLFFWIPFLWTLKYDNTHEYVLEQSANTTAATSMKQNTNSTNELVKLKTLLNDGAITNDEYTILKVKIISNEYDYANSIADQIVKLKGLSDLDLLTKAEYNSQKQKLVRGE